MQYEVPQFIDVKDKVFGSLTFAQFIFSAGGAGGAYAAVRFLFFPFNYIVALAILGLGLSLAFYEYNGRPFPVMLQAMLSFGMKKKLFLWNFRPDSQLRGTQTMPTTEINKQLNAFEKQEETTSAITQNGAQVMQQEAEKVGNNKNISKQRLKDIAWSLDVLDKK